YIIYLFFTQFTISEKKKKKIL
ncbi:hypothetical protein, partial [Plasmodium yoelii yoelii]